MDRLSNILKQGLAATQSAHAQHPSTDTLAAFVEQSLSSGERQTVLAHLAECALCRHAVALAAPERAAVPKGTMAAPGFRLQFPNAMRWASLAAALAVAVGVGVLSYERGTAPRQETTAVALPPADNVQSQSAAMAKDKAQGKKVPTPAISARKDEYISQPLFRDKSERQQETKQARSSVGQGGRGGMLGGIVSGAVPSTSLKADKTQSAAPLEANSPLQQTADAKAEQSNVLTSAPAAPPPPPAPAVTVTANAREIGREPTAGNSAQPAAQPLSEQKEVAGGLQSATAAGRAKSVRSAAVGGSLMAAKTFNDIGIVRWSITDLGQLQRRSPDGILTIVEPASGATIRAVAAQGIEVWAGGSQAQTSKLQLESPLLFHSSDAGETWTKVNGPWHSIVTRVDLAGVGNVSVVTKDGVWTTADAGKSWTKK